MRFHYTFPTAGAVRCYPLRTNRQGKLFGVGRVAFYALHKAVCGTQPLGLAVSKATGGFVTL